MWHNSSFSVIKCLSSADPMPISVSSSVVKIALVYPPSVYVLLLAFQQWRRPRSSPTPSSHADFFTFHMISLQLLIVVGMSVYFSGYFAGDAHLVAVGFYCTTMTHCLEMLVQCFTCVDRYLAVVHPVAYLKLKNAEGNKLRNGAMACAWLLCACYVAVLSVDANHVTTVFISLLGVNLSVICFYSASVLCVLVRPGPGDVEKVDRSRRKAFNAIMAIMAALLFWLVGIFFCLALQHALYLSQRERCMIFVAVLTFNVPSQMVLPLLYLKRKGKIPCCKKERKKERTGLKM